MAVSNDRKFTLQYVVKLLDEIKGKKLGDIDKSNQFARTIKSNKITGIAGDVIEQSVFGYRKDSKQECDIEIDGVLTELKTTGVRIYKIDREKVKGLPRDEYNTHLHAKEGISITALTFEPYIQTNFEKSHFWEKAKSLLIVLYEYSSYNVVPASEYANFPIVDYLFNSFSKDEKMKLQKDWELVRDYLLKIYEEQPSQRERFKQLIGFTHILRPQLLLIEIVPAFKLKSNGSYQKPRYRLKQTFIDYIIQGHFNKTRTTDNVSLKLPFSSYEELDNLCRNISMKYKGKNLTTLIKTLNITHYSKDITAQCVIKMFNADCRRLNQISDFNKTGIIIKTITITPQGCRTEDMKLRHIDFEEWADRDIDFTESDIYKYFCEHSFLIPVFCEHGDMTPQKKNETKEEYKKRVLREQGKTTFEGFKRFSFDNTFIDNEVRRTWEDSRKLIYHNLLQWEYIYDADEKKRMNKNGAYLGAPNFPKSSNYTVFFRGGAAISDDKSRIECVNGIRMLPQYYWLKGSYIANKIKALEYI